jgi:lysophospholipase L1-like esterase
VFTTDATDQTNPAEFRAARADATLLLVLHARLADIYSVLTVADLYDGVHPTQDAHAKVAAAFYATLHPLTACDVPVTACGP